jgi:hypothetical protein
MSSNWYVRLTRYASVHMVYAQMAQNSCGIACMMMVNFKMKKGLMAAGLGASAAVSVVPVIGSFLGATLATSAIDYAVKTEKEVYREYTKVTGTPYDGSAYSDMDMFPAVLRNLGLGNWVTEDAAGGAAGFPAAAKQHVAKGAPVIGCVEWNANSRHFVVIDEFHGDSACVCDPWDGQLHVTKMTDGGAVTYNAGERVIGWSIGGQKHSYPAGETGTFKAWITRRT